MNNKFQQTLHHHHNNNEEWNAIDNNNKYKINDISHSAKNNDTVDTPLIHGVSKNAMFNMDERICKEYKSKIDFVKVHYEQNNIANIKHIQMILHYKIAN